MKVRLNKSHLSNDIGYLTLNVEPARVAYIPKAEDGNPEIVLVYDRAIVPLIQEERELYLMSYRVLEASSQEVNLCYLKATVLLLTKEKDDSFRKDNPNTVAALEAILVEDK